MNCFIDLCDCDNRYGCCNDHSYLFWCWGFPASVITIPIWCPIAGAYILYDYCAAYYVNAKEFSDKKRNNYKVIDDTAK